jgi:hypothetical protein
MTIRLDLELGEHEAAALGAVIRAAKPEDYGVDPSAYHNALARLSQRLPSTPLDHLDTVETLLGPRIGTECLGVPPRLTRYRIVRSIFDLWRGERECVRHVVPRPSPRKQLARFANSQRHYAVRG